MCTLHKHPLSPPKSEHSQTEGTAHQDLLTWLLIALLMLFKIGILLAFCCLHATMEETPHEQFTLSAHHEYQKKTLC